jgi:hypothetical protein
MDTKNLTPKELFNLSERTRLGRLRDPQLVAQNELPAVLETCALKAEQGEYSYTYTYPWSNWVAINERIQALLVGRGFNVEVGPSHELCIDWLHPEGATSGND